MIAASACAQGIDENNASGPPIHQLSNLNGTDIWITSLNSYNDDYGVNDHRLRVGGNGDYYHSLIRFDVTDLPLDPLSVRVMLFCFGNGGGSNVGMSLDVLTSPWDNDTGWYSPAPSFAFLRTLSAPVLNQSYQIDITQVYHQWKSDAIHNQGLQLRPVSNLNQFNDFYSNEAADITKRPALVIGTKYGLAFPLPGRYSASRVASQFGAPLPNASCEGSELLNTGIDFHAPVGTLVRAAAGGTVKLATKDPKWGGYIVIEHKATAGGFVTTVYQHVEPIKKSDFKEDDKTTAKRENLKEGDIVQRYDVIGKVALGSEMAEPRFRFQLRESSYEYPINITNALPEEECGGLPAFPERFYDPRKIAWY